ELGQQDLTSLGFLPQSCRTVPVCRLVFGCGGSIFLGPAAREHEFAVKPEPGTHVGRSDRVQDHELVGAVTASGLGSLRSAMRGIEFRAARAAGRRLLAMKARKDVSARGAKDLDFRLPAGVSVPCDDPGWEKIDRGVALEAGRLHDP